MYDVSECEALSFDHPSARSTMHTLTTLNFSQNPVLVRMSHLPRLST